MACFNFGIEFEINDNKQNNGSCRKMLSDEEIMTYIDQKGRSTKHIFSCK